MTENHARADAHLIEPDGDTCGEEITIEERVIGYLNDNRPGELASLLRGVEQVGREVLDVIAFMLDGKTDDEHLMRATHPYRIIFKRWQPSRPRRRRGPRFAEHEAARQVEQLRQQGTNLKVAFAIVAKTMGRSESFVRHARYEKRNKAPPQPDHAL